MLQIKSAEYKTVRPNRLGEENLGEKYLPVIYNVWSVHLYENENSAQTLHYYDIYLIKFKYPFVAMFCFVGHQLCIFLKFFALYTCSVSLSS